MNMPSSAALALCFALLAVAESRAQVVINEVHYHPVEKAAFDAAGNPLLNLADDVHEFVELYNAGAVTVNLSGWTLTSAVEFTFPNGTSLAPGEYAVVAKNRARLATVYGLAPASVFGDFIGKLSNSGDTVRLKDAVGNTVDAMSYSPVFPWPITADALGANDDFTGFDSLAYQYKGRSLQRVSATASANDPANWIAARPATGGASFADLPTPGSANLISRPQPKPVVVAVSALQATDNAVLIRASAPVRVTCSFSSTATLSNVQVEYFLDRMDANGFGEARVSVPMTLGGNGQYTAPLPGQINRTLVRYRIVADRGEGVELVSPRADDPAMVQVGPPTYQATPPKRFPAPREAWHSYFVTPARNASAKPVYDVLVPTDGTSTFTFFNGINGLQALGYNCSSSPKRTTAESTTGKPRELPYVNPTDPLWNDVVPGVFVHNGVVRDIQIRYHGSRWNRRPDRKSFKVFFPEFLPFRDASGALVTSLFETDKGDMFMTAHGLHQHAGLPISPVRYVDWNFNSDGPITRLEQGEYNGELLDAYHEKMQRRNPGSKKEQTGEYYKSSGFIVSSNTAGEGPYGAGNGWRLPASGLWSELQRFDYTYGLQNHGWKGAKPIRDLINGMWNARGDNITSTSSPSNPNVANTRAWFLQNWDVQTELTSLALGNWMCPWDDTTQNHFLWRRAPVQKADGTFENAKWVRLLWDFDGMYGTGDGTSATASIYLGEVGNPNNNYRGPHYIKDSFFKAFRTEFKERLWFLNNTLLEPDNLQTLTFGTSSGGTSTYLTSIGFAVSRFNSVNTQCALGVFYKPSKPVHTAPANNAAVLPGSSLTASAYARVAAYTKTAAPDPSTHVASKWEIRTATGTYDDPVFVTTTTANLTTLPIPFGQLTYGQTYRWRVTYFDAEGHPSIASTETSFSYGPSSTVAGNVVINEVLAENRTAVLNGGRYPDFVELKNNTPADIDLSGWSLTDNELAPGKFSFPANTILPASGYLTVWCDNDTLAPGLHAGFALSRGGQRVILTQNGTVRDAVVFGPQVADLSIGRIADGTGAWTLNTPTQGAANSGHPFNSVASGLKINEWMANPASGDDWLELYNPDASPVALAGIHVSDTAGAPTLTKLPPLSFIGAGGFARFVADDSAQGFDHLRFKLAAGGDTIVVTDLNGTTTIDLISFGAQAVNVSEGRFRDGAATIVSFPQSPTPGESNYLPAPIVVNEVLSGSTLPLEDAIELHNPTAAAVSIGGWWLSDDTAFPQKFQIPAGTTIPAGGYAVFYESQFNATPGVGTSFSLSSFGDEVVLAAVDPAAVLTGFRFQQRFGAAAPGVSYGRVITSTGSDFFPQTARSLGQDAPVSVEQFRTGTGLANVGPAIGPIVINEVMYHPLDPAGGDNTRDEFIELHNVTTSPQDVSGWMLDGSVRFTFPAGTVIRPGDYVLVVGFVPGDATTLNAFRTAYGLGTGTRLYGPYTPKLGNGSERVELVRPGPPISGETPLWLVDQLQFSDAAPWPVAPDGTGPSLQRLSRTAFGNDVVNWSSAAATAGRPNAGQTPMADSDLDGLPDVWEAANGLDPYDAADVALDLDGDGQTNMAEYLSGTAANDPNDVLRAAASPAPGGGMVIRFTARAGKSYTVQYCENLTAGTWLKLHDEPAGATERVVEVPDPTAASQRFYRIITPAVP